MTEAEGLTPQLENAAKEVAVSGLSAQQVIATDDSSKWARQMFPDNHEQEGAAYRLIMHGFQMPGYTDEQSKRDLMQFSDVDQHKIQDYVANYKPSLDPLQVQAEAQRLEKLGLPRVSIVPHKPD